MKKLLISILILCFSAQTQALTLNSVYGNLTDCDTMTKGVFVVWWDNDWDYSADAEWLLDSLVSLRLVCLNDLNMADPPNVEDGYYYNVYIHHGADIFPSGWSNGQGTDANGYPFLTLPVGAHTDYVNVCHEGFHIFQYNANSPGFAYSGPSQWYIEASANWYAGIRNKSYDAAFVEAKSLINVPHIPLWLSYDNYPATYPNNWQRYVHQYAMALLLYYLTEEAGVSEPFITQGFFANTNELPQEYLFNQLGGNVFRGHFIDWAGHMINDFDFLTPGQVTRLKTEYATYADLADDNQFSATYTDEGSNGWYRPEDTIVTTGWSFNTYKVNNTMEETYTFFIEGDATGSEGDNAYFRGKLVVAGNNGITFHDLNMMDDVNGSLSINVTPEDTTIYYILASMPEIYAGVSQTYSYQMKIETGVPLGIQEINAKPRVIIGRYNILGQKVEENFKGIQLIEYSNGKSEKIWHW